MTLWSECRKSACAKRVDGIVMRCPDCNGPMTNSRWIRQTGWMMLVCGLLIGLPMIYVLAKFANVVFDPAAAVAQGRFGGTADQVPMAALLLVTLFAVAAALTAFGAMQAIKVYRSSWAKPVILGLAAATLGLLYYNGTQLKGPQPSVDRAAMH